MADQDQGAAIIAQKPFEPQRRFEVEMIGRLVEQQQIGLGEEDRGERRRASASRPTNRQPGACCIALVEPEPGEDARRPARCRMRLDLDEPGLDLGERAAAPPRLPARRAAASARGRRRAPSPAAFASPLGASWARKPMRQPRGNSIVPSSGCRTPRIRSSRVDLPAPLRPTSPTLLPSAILRMRLVEQPAPGAPADAVCHPGKGQHVRSFTIFSRSRAMSRPGRMRIGISGWTYARRGAATSIRAGLLQSDELSYASRQVDTIEINGTFYGLQRPDAFARWYDETPEGFVFAVKGPRFITHIRRLREIETPLANFFASGVLRLEEKLGPVLWQFPPSFRFSAERLDHFFSLLPRDTEAAAALAERHERVARRAAPGPRPTQRRELRHAIEIRHQSFLDPAFVALLRRHRVALVFADSVAWPYAEDVTADFVYLRLHGSEELYASGYSDEALDHWAARIKLWAAGSNRTMRG